MEGVIQGMHIESNNSLSDYHKIMAIAGLFKGNFSIDWFIDLLNEKTDYLNILGSY